MPPKRSKGKEKASTNTRQYKRKHVDDTVEPSKHVPKKRAVPAEKKETSYKKRTVEETIHDSPMKRKKPPACPACKARKVKCEYKDGSETCIKCTKAGAICGLPSEVETTCAKASNPIFRSATAKLEETVAPAEAPPYQFARDNEDFSQRYHNFDSTLNTTHDPADYPVSVASIAAAAAPLNVFLPPGPRDKPVVDGDDEEGPDGDEDEDEENDGDEAMSEEAKVALQGVISNLAEDSDDEAVKWVSSATSWEREAAALKKLEWTAADTDVELVSANDHNPTNATMEYVPDSDEALKESESSDEDSENEGPPGDSSKASRDEVAEHFVVRRKPHTMEPAPQPTRPQHKASAQNRPPGAVHRAASIMSDVSSPQAPTVKKRAKNGTGSRKKRKSKKDPQPSTKSREESSESETESLDPYPTASFEFSAACIEEGGKRPFTVQSTTTLANLVDIVAMKLKNHPTNVSLRYRLSTESLKDRTLITTDEELKHFIERLRPYHVHQRTASGKPSKARLKQVTVIFDDANVPEKEASTKGKNTKELSQKTILANKNIDEYTTRIDNLQATIRKNHYCEAHTKGGAEKYCHKVVIAGKTVHYALLTGHIKTWALLVAGDDQTFNIDKVPENLGLKDMRPTVHERQGSQAPPQGPTPMHNPHVFQGMQYGMPTPFFQNAMYPPPYHAQPFQHAIQQPVPFPQALPPPHPFGGNLDVSLPSIQDWLAYLDGKPMRARPEPGTTFTSLAGNFSDLGFHCLTQLIVDPSVASGLDLCKMLNLKPGFGLSLLTYAKQDLDAIRSGQLTIPAISLTNKESNAVAD